MLQEGEDGRVGGGLCLLLQVAHVQGRHIEKGGRGSGAGKGAAGPGDPAWWRPDVTRWTELR